MEQTTERRYWILSSDPRQYHWDTLFVKGKEMWRGAGSRPQIKRLVKQMRRGDRVLAFHATPDKWVYALAEVTRDPYIDPGDPLSKAMIIDLRAIERIPKPVPLADMRKNPLLRHVKFLKNSRQPVSAVNEAEYREILRMGGIVPIPGMPLP